jgi:2-iminoacetate synthase
MEIKEIIDEDKINQILDQTRNPSREKIIEILRKAELKKGLTLEEASYLINIDTNDKELIDLLFKTAGKIKQDIYGERLVFFAPIYISSFCKNDCEYCGFHCRNKTVRKKLTIEEIKEQVKCLIDMGHKRLLVEFAENEDECPIEYVTEALKTIYSVKSGNGDIRRVNVNIAATTVGNYKKLKDVGIGTYQLFQETYHQETYHKMHPKGPKSSYERQLFAHDRAIEGGIDDFGLGVLFGLYDYKFEVLALLSHAFYLDKKYKIGPHTFSVPRWQPAEGVDWDSAPYPVSEEDLLKIIAVLRMAVPYTGMIISTRETQEVRAKAFEIGISQTSAASITSPGGYGHCDHDKDVIKETVTSQPVEEKKEPTQFSTHDKRSVNEVIKGMLKQGLLPSFCTACYRKERTGEEFMKYAKSGDIHDLCRPNAILTFKEYIIDYADDEVKKLGEEIINKYLAQIENPELKIETNDRLKRIEKGERDLYF